VEEAEWRDQWKAYLHPRLVGRRLVVHPPWKKPAADLLQPAPGEAAAGPILTLEIDPARAFGTGTHPTTVGALELLEKAAGMLLGPGCGEKSRRLEALDLGTGSGILAIAAARLGFSRVTAVDCDPVAVEAARENAGRNGVGGVVEVAEGDALAVVRRLSAGRPAAAVGETGQGDRPATRAATGEAGRPEAGGRAPGLLHLVMANITTDMAVALAAPVAGLLAEGGFFVCSGVSSGEGAERVLGVARRAGLGEVERRTAEGWTSFLFRKGQSGVDRRTPSVVTRSPTPEGAPKPAVGTYPPPAGAPVPAGRATLPLAGGTASATGACAPAADSGTASPAARGARITPHGSRRRRPAALFHTLGCKANLYDTAVMMDALRAAGWRVIAPDQEEDASTPAR